MKLKDFLPGLLSLWVIILIECSPVLSQNNKAIHWWNPATSGFPVIEGQAWPTEVKNFYDRLPARAEKTVREPVWDLSENSAGLVIRFMASTPEIIVRYRVSGSMAFSHMPATGVSGLDLYAINSDGEWLWSASKYSFGDTILYSFTGLEPDDAYHKKGREYRLYLPLYNSVTWLEIGVPEGIILTPLPPRSEKPIVVYGTSIAQGGVASRPGMAWTSILGRKLDRPLVNLGFSGNGRLELPLIDLLGEIDAKIYVLDCLPNLTGNEFTSEEIKSRVISSVSMLQAKRPGIPILLAEHAGYTDGAINTGKRESYERTNKALQAAFSEMKSSGVENIFLLSMKEFNQDIDCMTDGVHPSDLGMLRYAEAYEKKIREIINETIGELSTEIPCIQNRDAAIYDWGARHNELLKLNKTNPPRIIFLGNSITHYWGGKPAAPISRGEDSWKDILEPLGSRNFGFGWDRVENVLWRVYHDELDGFAAEQVVILLGTNNLGLNSDIEITEGLKFLLHAIKARQPQAKILILGLLPRRDMEMRISLVNDGIAKMAATQNVAFADAGKLLLNKSGKIDESLFTDGLHPNAEGYQKVILLLKPNLQPLWDH